MAKKSGKKSAKPTKQSFAQYLKANPRERTAFIILVGLAVVLLVGWAVIAYHHHRHQQAIDREHAQYMVADGELENLSKALMNFEMPAEAYPQRECSYTSNPNEFARGRLVCNTAFYFVYDAPNKNMALETTDKISAFIQKQAGFRFGGYSDTLSNTDTSGSMAPTTLRTEDYKSMKSGLDCWTSYVYYGAEHEPDIQPKPKRTASGNGLIFAIGCGGDTNAAYYPIVE